MSLQPLLDRDRYTDEEWALASTGRCSYNTASYPALTWCGRPSSAASFYRWCDEHDREEREQDTRGWYGR